MVDRYRINEFLGVLNKISKKSKELIADLELDRESYEAELTLISEEEHKLSAKDELSKEEAGNLAALDQKAAICKNNIQGIQSLISVYDRGKANYENYLKFIIRLNKFLTDSAEYPDDMLLWTKEMEGNVFGILATLGKMQRIEGAILNNLTELGTIGGKYKMAKIPNAKRLAVGFIEASGVIKEIKDIILPKLEEHIQELYSKSEGIK